jgi:hypothetical protein
MMELSLMMGQGAINAYFSWIGSKNKGFLKYTGMRSPAESENFILVCHQGAHLRCVD